MNKITFIGDVHCKCLEYKKIIDRCEQSFCVGDFGFKSEWDWFINNVYDPLDNKHWINPGNHDYGRYLQHKLLGSTGNHSYFEEFGIFTVRGAESIDKHQRTEGVDWFSNEELTFTEQLQAFDAFTKFTPKIVISHDCPQTVMEKLFGYPDKSQTRQMLQAMFDFHKPDLWVFGHHHRSKDVQIDGTRFVCLSELETMILEID